MENLRPGVQDNTGHKAWRVVLDDTGDQALFQGYRDYYWVEMVTTLEVQMLHDLSNPAKPDAV
eukprot:scaffold68317_cov19-Tisochrysis_lutea.AAC.1